MKKKKIICSSKFFTGRKNRTFINEKIIKNSLVPNQNNDNKSQIDLLFQAITRIPFPLPISKQRKRTITPNHAQTLPKNPKPLPSFPSKEKKRNILVHPPFDRYEFGYESKFRLMKRSRCGPQRTTPQRRRRRRRRRRQRWRRRWRWPGER